MSAKRSWVFSTTELVRTMQQPAGLLHAFVTVFALPGEECAMTASAHDTRRLLRDAEAPPGAAASDASADPAPVASAAASVVGARGAARWRESDIRECAMRRRESGIFYDAARLVMPGQKSRVLARLAELEREVQGAAPIHVCFSSGRVFSILLSSCVVVSVRFAEDGVQVADCTVDRRLAAALASVHKDKAGDSLHGAPSCSAGYLTPRFAVVAHGDGRVSVVCARKTASQTHSLFEPHAEHEVPDALHVASSVEIASAACRILVNADLDLVAAQTGTAIHFLALSAAAAPLVWRPRVLPRALLPSLPPSTSPSPFLSLQLLRPTHPPTHRHRPQAQRQGTSACTTSAVSRFQETRPFCYPHGCVCVCVCLCLYHATTLV